MGHLKNITMYYFFKRPVFWVFKGPKTINMALLALCCLSFHGKGIGQEVPVPLDQDSILPINLAEVIVIAPIYKDMEHRSYQKPLATLDGYLESSQKVSMIKRGAYAWEPMINDMASERLSVTIDGMRIFGACTDRMDPVTSYVDVSNLSNVHVASGQQGAKMGNAIGGALDMRLEKSGFVQTDWKSAVETGFESNNNARIYGYELNYASDSFYVDSDIIYRDADNYISGDGEEVAYSQFTKYNVSLNTGVKFSESQKLLASFIFDEAKDVGYPALPMDVSLARAFIGSLSWVQDTFLGDLYEWETKIYANSITHIMDDSQRPDVPIRMDMPGWSDTYGFYSQARLQSGGHKWLFKWDGFYNKSLAEMTMYPNNPNEASMFMLTWPDVRTLNTGLFAENTMAFENSVLIIAGRISAQGTNVANEFGRNSLRIFYHSMEQTQARFLKSLSTEYRYTFKNVELVNGVSYGDRAPSVSEAFGFYLFNSFDNHDYIGDPNLKNEGALELKSKISLPFKNGKIGAEGNFFHTQNYILGEIDPTLSTMTIGADGVKIYRNLEYANLFNVSINGVWDMSKNLKYNGLVSYHRGVDQDSRNLPFISPLTYSTSFRYSLPKFSASLSLRGAADQVNFNSEFGEDSTSAYNVVSLSVAKTFFISDDRLDAQVGVENLFDTYYSTYTDWNNIPRMGRNIYLTLSYAIN